MLKPLDFPRENSMILEMEINSFAMAKTTFFSKRHAHGAFSKELGRPSHPTAASLFRSWLDVLALTNLCLG